MKLPLLRFRLPIAMDNLENESITAVCPIAQCSPNGTSLIDLEEVRVFMIAIFSTVFFICLLGNILVLLVITINKGMRTLTNFFLANLALADLFVGIFSVIQYTVYSHVNDHSKFLGSHFMCGAYLFTLQLGPSVSAGILVLVALERYLAIVHPMSSTSKILADQRFHCLATVIVWVLGGLSAVPFYVTASSSHFSCHRNYGAYYGVLKTVTTVNFIVWYVIPVTILTVIYAEIAVKLWGSTSRNSVLHSSLSREGNRFLGSNSNNAANSHNSAGNSSNAANSHENGKNNKTEQIEGSKIGGERGIISPWKKFTSASLKHFTNREGNSGKTKLSRIKSMGLSKFCKNSIDKNQPSLLMENSQSNQCAAPLNDEINSSICDATVQKFPVKYHLLKSRSDGLTGATGEDVNGYDIDNSSSAKQKGALGLQHSSSSCSTAAKATNRRIRGDVPSRCSQPFLLSPLEKNGNPMSLKVSPGAFSASPQISPNKFSLFSRKSQSSRSVCDVIAGRKNTVRLLITVTLLFGFLTLPHHLRMLWVFYRDQCYSLCLDDPIIFLQAICYLLLFVNSGVNPIVYAFMKPKFRQASVHLFSCRSWRDTKRAEFFKMRRRLDTLTSGADVQLCQSSATIFLTVGVGLENEIGGIPTLTDEAKNGVVEKKTSH